jgi:uroporphyrinogen decarboxylase
VVTREAQTVHNREQLMAAARRGRCERVPYTYDATTEADALFKCHLGLGEKDSVADHFRCNTFTSPWAALGAGPRMPEREARLRSHDPNVRVDSWGVRRELVETTSGARYFEIRRFPLADARTVADVEAYDWPTPADVVWPDVPAGLDITAWKSDKFTLDMAWIGPFGLPWALRGMEQLMADLYEQPEIVEAIVAKVEAYTLPCLQIAMEKYPGLCDFVGSGDDYGMESGLFISKAMIDRFFMPSLKRHYAAARRYGVGGYHHCCGAIFDIIPSFIDAGVQVLNPIQTSAHGMDPVRLKQAFGRDLAFHGGMDIQVKLISLTPEGVREEVRRLVDTLGPEGYILAPSHSLQTDTPPANLVALYEEIAKYG